MRPDGPRDPIAGPDDGPAPPFPLRLSGKVIKGFGRGSKELGIPTANIPLPGVSIDGKELDSGIYYGWAGLSTPPPPNTPTTSSTSTSNTPSNPSLTTRLTNGLSSLVSSTSTSSSTTPGQVYPMVMSVGWNPYYKNTVRSAEIHIIHRFSSDFYGHDLNIVILGFIRPEYDYVSLESLIADINEDIEVTKRSLQREGYARFKEDGFLLEFPVEENGEGQERL